MTPTLRCGLLLALLTPCALAGGSGENALLIVDPSSPDALHAANHYKHARQIPDVNVLYMEPGAASYADFVAHNQTALLGELESRGIADHIDYIVVMPGTNFFVPAAGLAGDGCAPVNRFGIAGAYTTTFVASEVLGGVSSGMPNRFYSTSNTPLAFDSETSYLGGQPSTAANARRYFLSAMLGYTGERGNTIEEILDLVDRSVAADGTFPTGTTYYMHTTDFARSSPRDGAYPGLANAIVALGGAAQVLFADLPLGQHDALGIMTGLANPDIDNADLSLLPGSFADHLTSFAGKFDTASQTKMSRWISKGASGTSGTVEEPCNYSGKFPHARLHLFHFAGLSLGEAWMRSMAWTPFQNLLYGDPLTRPFAAAPMVDLPDAPAGPVTGDLLLHPVAVATATGAQVDGLEVLVDGVLTRRLEPGQAFPLFVSEYSDGWHELRVLAHDDSAVRSVGRWIGGFVVDSGGRAASVTPSTVVGDRATAFDFGLAAQGAGLVELRLVQSGRVLAAASSSPASLRLYGENLGAGTSRVQAEALFADGELVRSAPLELDVAATGAGASGAAPVAFDFQRDVLVGGLRVLELPASFDDPSDSATFAVTVPSGQTVVLGGFKAFRWLDVPSGATGTDSLTYNVTTPSGTSADATISLRYVQPGACPAPTNYCVAGLNSQGTSASIGATGTASVLENELVLTVAGAVPLKFGLFFYGPTQVQVPLGDGFLCIGSGAPGIYRLPPPQQAGFFGEGTRALDLNDPLHTSGGGAIEAGSSWNFQYWYRDSASPGGFNLSDGLAVQFCP